MVVNARVERQCRPALLQRRGDEGRAVRRAARGDDPAVAVRVGRRRAGRRAPEAGDGLTRRVAVLAGAPAPPQLLLEAEQQRGRDLCTELALSTASLRETLRGGARREVPSRRT